jgi:hypothetical protein
MNNPNFSEKPSEERAKIIDDLLIKKGVIDSCAECNKGELFYITEGQLFLGLCESSIGTIGTIPVIIKICDNCGHVNQYGSGYLEKINNENKQ